MDFKELKKDLKNKNAIIPNLLSASRIPAPIVILAFTFSGNVIGTLAAASLFALTDFFDGKIARRFNGETKLGALLDTISDKVFSIGTTLPLIPFFPPLALTLGLEGAIAYINSKSLLTGGNPKSIFQGKVKTAFLSTTILMQCVSIASGIPLIQMITNGLYVATTALQISNVHAYNKIAKEQATNIKQQIKPIQTIEETKEDTNEKEKTLTIEEEIQMLKDFKEELTAEEVIEKPKVKIKK